VSDYKIHIISLITFAVIGLVLVAFGGDAISEILAVLAVMATVVIIYHFYRIILK